MRNKSNSKLDNKTKVTLDSIPKWPPFSIFFAWHFWPRSRQNITLNFNFDSEAKWANLQSNKRILKWQPFWNMVYTNVKIIKNHRSNEGEAKVEGVSEI